MPTRADRVVEQRLIAEEPTVGFSTDVMSRISTSIMTQELLTDRVDSDVDELALPAFER